MDEFITFTFEGLMKERIQTLRDLGREIGVKAPASLSKEDVIKEILAIQAGEKAPEEASNRGAPPKTSTDLSKFRRKKDQYDESLIGLGGGMICVKDHEDGAQENADKDAVINIVEGIFELNPNGYGFIRINNYENSKGDAYISQVNIRKYNLRVGDKVEAETKRVREGDSAAVQKILKINDLEPNVFLKRNNFDDLVAYYPTEKIRLEREDLDDLALRSIDLFSPMGFGQRGIIVAPPKTGKTTLLKKIANAIETNYPEVKLFVLLIGERPEEVTDMKRSINGEVVYSTFDERAEHHIKAAELVINRAKRLVEVGKDVVILMDSITRLARAYNTVVAPSGKTLSGGIDPLALVGPKRFFGAARNIEDGGSLTVLSTALVDTGSRMDDVIYEEFKGTGNMEICLSRNLSEKRIFPAIDLDKSGTRKEELLLSKQELDATYSIRGILSQKDDAEVCLLEMLGKTKNNVEFVQKSADWVKLYNKK